MSLTTPKEGKLTIAIEKQTSKVASGVYLTAAMTAIVASLILKSCGKKHMALFVGQWVSPFLIMGLYNKIVKTQGHD